MSVFGDKAFKKVIQTKKKPKSNWLVSKSEKKLSAHGGTPVLPVPRRLKTKAGESKSQGQSGIQTEKEADKKKKKAK